jgi:hypothetical protein
VGARCLTQLYVDYLIEQPVVAVPLEEVSELRAAGLRCEVWLQKRASSMISFYSDAASLEATVSEQASLFALLLDRKTYLGCRSKVGP